MSMVRSRVAVTAMGALLVWACSSDGMKPAASGGQLATHSGGATSGGASSGQAGSKTSQGGASSGQGGASVGGVTSSQGGSKTGQGGASAGGTKTSQGGTVSIDVTTGGGSSVDLTGQGGASSSQGGTKASVSGVTSIGGVSSSVTGGRSAAGGVTTSGSSSIGGVTSSIGGSFSTSQGGQSTDTGGTSSTRLPSTRPEADAGSCGKWALTEGVCCAQYCTADNKSESCDSCGGPGAAGCEVVNAKACTSGMWPEVHSVTNDEPWHYSRSTHFGLTDSGACAFGLYGICNKTYKFTSGYAEKCDAFCKAYPKLCEDPVDRSLHGNFAAPQGNYYSQFWPSLPGDNDNYLSCGECYELVRTQKDGTEYQPGDTGYTVPIVIQVVDSCPCAANSKWCCGSGRDHCGEVSDFKYGCQLPPSPPPPKDHDPVAGESIHFDLSDIAMARLQTGDPNGAMVDGVVPTKYRRIPCPVAGNMYFWLQTNANEYYFSFSVVNMAGLGAPAKVEARLPSGDWVLLKRNSNYTMSRPQERYGTWALPQGEGPFALPISIRVTDGGGRAVVAEGAIKSWTPADATMAATYYIDSGVQF